MRRELPILLAAVLVSAPIVGAVDLGVDEAAGPGDGVPLAAHGGDHPPIRIHGDEQFLLPSSGVTGGSGTAEDPYVISGWTVKPARMHRGDAFQDGDGVAEKCKPSPVVSQNQARAVRLHGIEIVDTSKHVVIENVTVMPREDTEVPGVGPPWNRLHVNSEFLIGILLRDADHVTIRNVTVGQADGPTLYRGICAKDSDDLRIQNSTVQNTKGNDAVEITRGSDVAVKGNVLTDGRVGVEAIGVDTIDVVGNVIPKGVDIEGGSDARVVSNTLQGGGGIGVSVSQDARGVAILQNVITGYSNDGVALDSGSDIVLRENNIEGNGDTGLQTFVDVDAADNWWGADSGPSGGVTDDCTGTTADGGGDRIWASGVADVCFDPWLTSPNPAAGA